MLVDTLIDAEWNLRRFRTVEAQLWEKEALSAYKPNQDVILAQAYWSGVDRFARLQRRVDTAHKNYRTALQDLQRLQAEEAALPVDPDPDPAPQTRPTRPFKSVRYPPKWLRSARWPAKPHRCPAASAIDRFKTPDPG
jgi:hypothetical protein